MPYLGNRQGDYLGGYYGDPGFFSKILKIGGKLVGSFLGLGSQPPPQPQPQPTYRQAGFLQVGGPRGIQMGTADRPPTPRAYATRATRLRPPGQVIARSVGAAAAAGFDVKRRRMNVANPKALRRAIRRQAGFVKLARRALKGSGYQIVSRGSRSRRINVREAGSGSVTVQS